MLSSNWARRIIVTSVRMPRSIRSATLVYVERGNMVSGVMVLIRRHFHRSQSMPVSHHSGSLILTAGGSNSKRTVSSIKLRFRKRVLNGLTSSHPRSKRWIGRTCLTDFSKRWLRLNKSRRPARIRQLRAVSWTSLRSLLRTCSKPWTERNSLWGGRGLTLRMVGVTSG